MKPKKNPFCKVPFVLGFTTIDNRYRDCCSKRPRLESDPSHDFQQWWKSDELNKFRKQMMETTEFPPECASCKLPKVMKVIILLVSELQSINGKVQITHIQQVGI